MTPNEKRIEEIRERCEKADDGPWSWEQVGEKSNGYMIGASCDRDGKPLSGRIDEPDFVVDELAEWNAIESKALIGSHDAATCNYGNPDFIAHARADIPWLLARLAEARAALQFYANPDNYSDSEPGHVEMAGDYGDIPEWECDDGDIARAALKEKP